MQILTIILPGGTPPDPDTLITLTHHFDTLDELLSCLHLFAAANSGRPRTFGWLAERIVIGALPPKGIESWSVSRTHIQVLTQEWYL